MALSASFPKVFIVILNWNGWTDTIECLESNYSSTYPQFEVVVVDNGSTDGSLEKIRAWAGAKGIPLQADLDLRGHRPESYPVSPFEPRALSLIETGKNLGFSGGNNRGIEYALANHADCIFLLNNDTTVEEATLELLVSALHSGKRVGAVFPLVLGTKGEIQVPVYLRPPFTFLEILLASNLPGKFLRRYQYRNYLKRRNPYPNYSYDRIIALPNIAIAAGSLFRVALLEEVGLLDENLFMYYEEDVLIHKLKHTEWLVCMEPRARIVHKGGVDNAKLPPAFLYRKVVCGEIYYLRHYAQTSSWQRAFLKLLRAGQYFWLALTKSSDYWSSLPEFSREYLWR